MAEKADLHIHTTRSDGRLSPEEVILLASEKKMSAVAITDHDTFEGYHEARELAESEGVELVPGVEITTVYNNRECHLLAYYFDPDSEHFSRFVLRQRFNRKERIKGIIDKLQKQGLDVDYNEVWAQANGANIGRPHVAQVLIDKGYVGNYPEAFMRYLSEEQLGGIESGYPAVNKAIQMVKEVGGAAILAHPSKFYTNTELDELINMGLDGIECIHPSHNWDLQLRYSKLCESRSLLKTGGSDYHGNYESADTVVGIMTISAANVQQMKRITDQRKKISEIKN